MVGRLLLQAMTEPTNVSAPARAPQRQSPLLRTQVGACYSWVTSAEPTTKPEQVLLQATPKNKEPSSDDEGSFNSSLTMSYFHPGTRTIIGAEAFHCPVRDGKEWDHLAMVIRLNRLPPCAQHKVINS